MDEIVTIPLARLKELQELEKSLPILIDSAIKEFKKSNLEKLHERDKINPSAVKARVKRYVEKHRDEINKKLREKRKLMKEKTELATGVTSISDKGIPKNTILISETVEKPNTTVRSDVVVKFDT
jgi:hypothetical protein